MFPLPGCVPHEFHPLLPLSLSLLQCGTAEPLVMAMVRGSLELSTQFADVAHYTEGG